MSYNNRIYQQQSGMQESSSRISREEQVKVVVRLKPDEEAKNLKCVYLSELENQLVVETDLKKEIFVFDHVAHQSTTQLQIYKTIGEEAVSTSYEGYNCSIFAYGQTGAGKTYSIMGNLDHLQADIYCQTRGILPRIIQDIVKELNSQKDQKYTLTCSYMEIYNEQIYDLLSTDKRPHQIRQGKKGVFIEGLKECQLTSYKQGIQLILQGQNSRKMAITTMNTESSRSHAIFTIFIQSKIIIEEKTITKKSKLNIIDLAGSQRIKHTNVEGERLKQGCNINKSLHVLANVINSLVESTKKKKYIPYRDSKLTYYLKDSLGGNSITKVLANIHCGKDYLGDTLSTLMFAKRIKNLKLKVQLNVNQSENFNNLRQEVKRLRQELAEARYFKNESQKQNDGDLSITFEKVTTDNTDYEVSTPKLQIIEIFQQNELHYKSLIEIYESHMKQCISKPLMRKNINMIGQRKTLQAKNNALMGLLKRIPSFTKIYKQNLLLKQSKHKDQQEQQNIPLPSSRYIKIHNQTPQEQIHSHNYHNYHKQVEIEEVINKYQGIISQMHEKFTTCLQTLEKNYLELQTECKRKDKKIKQILQNNQISPEIQQLQNENEYLHLNILNLQNQISKLQQNQNKLRLQNKQSKRNSVRNSKHESFMSQPTQRQREQNDDDLLSIIEKLKEIHTQALLEAETAESQKKQMEHIINQLRNQINTLMNQNNKLQRKQARSRSRKSREHKSQMSSSGFINDDTSLLCLPKNKSSQMGQSELIHQIYSKQIMQMKYEIKINKKEILDLRNQIDSFMSSDYKIEQQFGKSVDEIIVEYRNLLKKQKNKYDERPRIPKSSRVENKEIEQRFAATTNFDQIYLNQKKDVKHLHLNLQNRDYKAKIDKLKKVTIGSSSVKNSNNNSNFSSNRNSFYHQ